MKDGPACPPGYLNNFWIGEAETMLAVEIHSTVCFTKTPTDRGSCGVGPWRGSLQLTSAGGFSPSEVAALSEARKLMHLAEWFSAGQCPIPHLPVVAGLQQFHGSWGVALNSFNIVDCLSRGFTTFTYLVFGCHWSPGSSPDSGKLRGFGVEWATPCGAAAGGAVGSLRALLVP